MDKSSFAVRVIKVIKETNDLFKNVQTIPMQPNPSLTIFITCLRLWYLLFLRQIRQTFQQSQIQFWAVCWAVIFEQSFSEQSFFISFPFLLLLLCGYHFNYKYKLNLLFAEASINMELTFWTFVFLTFEKAIVMKGFELADLGFTFLILSVIATKSIYHF